LAEKPREVDVNEILAMVALLFVRLLVPAAALLALGTWLRRRETGS